MSPRRPVRLDPVTLLLRLRSELASANLMLAIYRLADVENDGATQTIRDAETGQIVSKTTWGPDGPEAEPIIEPAFAPAAPPVAKILVEFVLPTAIVAAKTLYDRFASVPVQGPEDDGKRAVASFRAYDFDTADNARIAPDYVGRVDNKDVDAACPRHGEVQDRTDAAYDRAMQGASYPDAKEKGKAIHLQLAADIKALGDPNLRAEVSILKSAPGKNRVDSVRVDVLERVGNGTVCVYDVKTGDRGLSEPRSIEIARNALKY